MFKGVECSDEIGSCYKPGCQQGLARNGWYSSITPSVSHRIFSLCDETLFGGGSIYENTKKKNSGYGSQWPRNSDIAIIYLWHSMTIRLTTSILNYFKPQMTNKHGYPTVLPQNGPVCCKFPIPSDLWKSNMAMDNPAFLDVWTSIFIGHFPASHVYHVWLLKGIYLLVEEPEQPETTAHLAWSHMRHMRCQRAKWQWWHLWISLPHALAHRWWTSSTGSCTENPAPGRFRLGVQWLWWVVRDSGHMAINMAILRNAKKTDLTATSRSTIQFLQDQFWPVLANVSVYSWLVWGLYILKNHISAIEKGPHTITEAPSTIVCRFTSFHRSLSLYPAVISIDRDGNEQWM